MRWTPCLLALLACHDSVPDAAAVRERAAEDRAPAPELRRPRSVVLVTIDTLRADALGVFGGPVPTPTLDGLAASGWAFERCFSASMLTNPSHASIMTSLYPRDHGVYDNESGVHDEARTLAQALERHGLSTAAVIGFPHLNPEVANLGHGFDTVTRADAKNERRADETSRAALQALDGLEPGAPFFMWVHYVDPHAPYEPPAGVALPEAARRTPMARAHEAAPGFQRKNPYFKGAFTRHRHTEELVARYHAEVAATDAGLAVLLDGLRARGVLDDTAIVVTSDHGENLGEHQLYFHHGGLYEESVHVPLIIKVPGATPARLAGLVETVDIAPTILELVGAPRWEPMRGDSLVQVARGTAPGRAIVFSEHMQAQLAAARSSTGALIVHRKTTSQFPSYPIIAGRQEYYDVRHDPGERTRLPALGPEAERLASHLARYLGEGPVMAAKQPLMQDRESLRALGYIE